MRDIKTIILREVSDPSIVYGILVAETEESHADVIAAFLNAKADEARVNREWQVSDILRRLPKEWNARVEEDISIQI